MKRCKLKIILKSVIIFHKTKGGSSGAAVSIAVEYAKTMKEGERCVVVCPDSIRNYMLAMFSLQQISFILAVFS